METKTQDLLRKYPWLSKVNSVEEYVSPEYYKHLLKTYSFDGLSDLEILGQYVKKLKADKILELGCGSGRASEVVAKNFLDSSFVFSDLSSRMLGAAQERISDNDSIFVESDAIEYMENTNEIFDFTYTLWSFSHSVHQHVHELGVEKASEYISTVLKKFIRENIPSNGSFFLIHFDSMSDEQRILMKQWKRVFAAFDDVEHQSPSKQIIERTLTSLDNSDEIALSINHLRGDQISYESEDSVLETFMNFHLETYFNQHELTKDVLADIKESIIDYRNSDGSFAIAPGCYIYSFTKR